MLNVLWKMKNVPEEGHREVAEDLLQIFWGRAWKSFWKRSKKGAEERNKEFLEEDPEKVPEEWYKKVPKQSPEKALKNALKKALNLENPEIYFLHIIKTKYERRRSHST